MATASDPVVDEARERYEAGDFEAARDKAVAGLAERPDDPELLRIAGLSGVELDDPEAIGYLQKVTEIAPDDADAWRELGGALTMSGRLDEAGAAFRKATDLRPSDTRVLVDLGHVVLGSGQVEEALPYFEQARVHEPGNTEALPRPRRGLPPRRPARGRTGRGEGAERRTSRRRRRRPRRRATSRSSSTGSTRLRPPAGALVGPTTIRSTTCSCSTP